MKFTVRVQSKLDDKPRVDHANAGSEEELRKVYEAMNMEVIEIIEVEKDPLEEALKEQGNSGQIPNNSPMQPVEEYIEYEEANMKFRISKITGVLEKYTWVEVPIEELAELSVKNINSEMIPIVDFIEDTQRIHKKDWVEIKRRT